jgi:hypothetical protein
MRTRLKKGKYDDGDCLQTGFESKLSSEWSLKTKCLMSANYWIIRGCYPYNTIFTSKNNMWNKSTP